MPNNNMAGPIAGLWPEDHAQELARLVASGMVYRLVAEALNEKFGTSHTKNAIVGKVQRLGLTAPDKPKRPPYVRKPKARRPDEREKRIITFGDANATRVYSSVQREQYKVRCVEIVPRHLSVLDLEPNDCRYPYGDGPITFCGHEKLVGSSYCIAHHVLCQEKPRAPIHRFAGVAA